VKTGIQSFLCKQESIFILLCSSLLPVFLGTSFAEPAPYLIRGTASGFPLPCLPQAGAGMTILNASNVESLNLGATSWWHQVQSHISEHPKGREYIDCPRRDIKMKSHWGNGQGREILIYSSDLWSPTGKPGAPNSRPCGATSRPKAVAFCCRGKSRNLARQTSSDCCQLATSSTKRWNLWAVEIDD